ncbi:glycosyltransferase 87 family protein [Arthrospiribacter ruber]
MKKILLLLVHAVAFLAMAYFLERRDFWWQLGLYAILFGTYYVAFFREKLTLRLWEGILAAAILRLLFLFSIPVLSDDFYRFVFDGQLLYHGVNPYLHLPVESAELFGFGESAYWQSLLKGMNSPEYYSVYPPLHQFVFWISALAGENLLANVILLRFVILGFEAITFFLLFQIIHLKNLPLNFLWLYAFNPLVILELSGNLHFEGMVLAFLLLAVYSWERSRSKQSGLAWSLASGLKLTPLILGPLWLRSWSGINLRTFLIFAGVGTVFFLSPLFFGNSFSGFWSSFQLYQNSFEFNASFYYLIREIWSGFVGYNPIIYLVPILSAVTLFGILLFAYLWKVGSLQQLVQGGVWIYLIYLLLQPVVHPWYLIPAFGLSVLIRDRIFLAWTAVVFLSYSAYQTIPVKENFVLIFLEYGVVIFFLFSSLASKAYKVKVHEH